MAWVSLPLTDLFVLGFVKDHIYKVFACYFICCSSFENQHEVVGGKHEEKEARQGVPVTSPESGLFWFPVSHLIQGLVDK